jgi:hypothetical protein
MANAISLDSLDNEVKNKREQLTEVQFENYLLNLKGTKVNWRRKVLNVINMGYTVINNRYTVKLKNNDSWAAFVFFISDEQLALTLNKNQEYDFSGEILSAVTTVPPVYLYIGISGYD